MDSDSPPPSQPPPRPAEDPRVRFARRTTIGLFYGGVVLFCAAMSTQISIQVLSTNDGAYPGTCRDGLRALAEALDSARNASEGVDDQPEVAIAKFRGALSPAWDARDAVTKTCAQEHDATLTADLDLIERLRAAEESAVRRDARDLSSLRRKTREAVARDLSPKASP
jgi:hypothetical protein